MALTLSRPKKLDHVDTLRYEIDMLRFTASKLSEQKLTERDAWVYLESFLLHYRNLIEFLGKGNPGDTDVRVTNIWALAVLKAPANLKEIHARGRELWKRYEPSDKQGGGRISQYLQHCTTRRIHAKDWEVSTMFNEIESVLKEVETHFGARSGMLPAVSALGTLDMFSASTTTYTMTTNAARLITGIDSGLQIKKKS